MVSKEVGEELFQGGTRSITGAIAEKGITADTVRQIVGDIPNAAEIAETAVAVMTTMGPSAVIQGGREAITQGFDARDRSKKLKNWMLNGPGPDFLINDEPDRAAKYAAKPNPSSKDLAELLGVTRREGWTFEERVQLARNLRERQANAAQDQAAAAFDVTPEAQAQMDEVDRQIKAGEIDLGQTAPVEEESPPAQPPQTPPQPAAQAAPDEESPPEPSASPQGAVIAPGAAAPEIVQSAQEQVPAGPPTDPTLRSEPPYIPDGVTPNESPATPPEVAATPPMETPNGEEEEGEALLTPTGLDVAPSGPISLVRGAKKFEVRETESTTWEQKQEWAQKQRAAVATEFGRQLSQIAPGTAEKAKRAARSLERKLRAEAKKQREAIDAWLKKNRPKEERQAEQKPRRPIKQLESLYEKYKDAVGFDAEVFGEESFEGAGADVVDFPEFVIRAGTEEAKSSAEEIKRLLPENLRKRVRLAKSGTEAWLNAKEWEDQLRTYGAQRIAASIVAAAERESGSAKAEAAVRWILDNRDVVDPVDFYQAFKYQQIALSDTAGNTKAATAARPTVVKIDNLVPGQTFTIAGDTHTVTGIDENGAVTIVDGLTGEFYPSQEIAIDKGSLAGEATEDDSFSVDEFEADEEPEAPDKPFRAFVEAKGIEWSTVKVGTKVRADLRAEFEAAQAGKPEPTEADRAWSEAREAKDQLAAWMQGKSFSNMPFDTEFYKLIGEIIQSHVRAGVVTFKGFYGSMAKKYGLARAEKIRPGLIDAWQAARLTNDEMDEPPPRFGEYGDKEPITIKNAYTEAKREEFGLKPVTQAARRSFGVVWDQALEIIATNPSAQDALITELSTKARAVEDIEDALLLHRQIMLQTDYRAALETLDSVRKTGEDAAIATAEKRLDALRALLEQLYDVNKAVGTATGRGLAARKMLAYEDFSLAKMLMEKRAATGVKTLDKDAAEEVRKAQQRIEELEKTLQDALLKAELLEAEKAADSAIDELKGEVKAEKKSKPRPAKGPKAVSAARAEADAALAAFKKRFAAFSAGTPSSLAAGASELLASGVTLVKAYVKLGVESIGQLLAQAKTDMGDAYTPEFEKAIGAAWDEYRRSNIVIDDVKDLSKVARSLAKDHIRDGVKGREAVVDKVWADLTTVLPDLTRRETMDAISLYGQYKELDKDATKVRLREIAGELQQIAKLEDMAGGKAPLLTGQERRAPTDEERRLIKEVNEAKKKGGFIVTDPARQLRTALNALETRLTNAIKDLEWEIANQQKIVKQKTGVPTSPKIEALRKRRDELKERRDAIFGKPGKTDAQRLKEALAAKDRAIAEWQRRIDERDFGPRVKKTGPVDPALAAKQAELDAVKAEFAELESLRPDDKGQVSEYRAIVAYWRSLARQAEKYRQRLADKDFAPKPRKPRRMDKQSRKILGELELEKTRFRQGLIDDRRARRTAFAKLGEIPVEFVRVSRAIVTSFDFSAVLRQGGVLAGSHPLMAKHALMEMFRAFASEAAFAAIETEIASRPNALSGLDVRAGVEFTGIEGKLTKMEEAYRSVWIEMIAKYAASGKPGAAKMAAKAFNATIGGSERAYVSFLNVLRASVFDHLIAQLGDVDSVTEHEARIIANYVNVATGRGDMGRFRKAADMLAEVFFAPRWVWSRFQLLTLQPLRKDFGKGSWRVRRLIAKEYARSLGAMGVFYGTAGLALTALLGAAGSPDDPEAKWSIELDPRSSDFGKIKIGRTRIDPLAGLSQTTVFLTRMIGGESKTRFGEIKPLRGEGVEFGASNWSDVLTRFGRSKLSPIFGAAWDIGSGETYDYQPTTVSTVAGNMLTPLSIGDIASAMKENGIPAGAAIGLATIFGLSVQTYAPDKPLEKLPQFPGRRDGESEETYRMRVGAWGRKIDTQPADNAAKLRREFLQNKTWQAAENPVIKRQAGETVEHFNTRKAERAQEISDAKSLLGERSTSELVALLREEALSRKESVRVWDTNGKMTAFGQRQARLIRLSRQARPEP
ncbi:MAG: hypothetical protein AB7I42_23975 [Bradyrhizobium sp.]|uniref:hypothetical protein n=1 Tax=Bradyrhizobium sp. TaxID=376 RepID=UPI003D135CD9